MARCAICGSENDEEVRFCTSCGTSMQGPEPGSRTIRNLLVGITLFLALVVVAVIVVVLQSNSESSIAGVYEQTRGTNSTQMDSIKWTENHQSAGTATDVEYNGNGVIRLDGNGSFNFEFNAVITEYTTGPKSAGFASNTSFGNLSYSGTYQLKDEELTLYSLPFGDLSFSLTGQNETQALVEVSTRCTFAKSSDNPEEVSP